MGERVPEMDPAVSHGDMLEWRKYTMQFYIAKAPKNIRRMINMCLDVGMILAYIIHT
jgi:hypothetical protein